MRLDEVIDGVLTGRAVPADTPEEAMWLDLWRTRNLSDEPLEVMAALGGALADRLAWVFLAGYQATIYRCFPDLPREPGWTAFVNTEDRSGALPGTTLGGQGEARRLNGWKGWVAASAHADRFLVSAQQERTPFILVRRDTPGVRIHERGSSSYLPELTQGRAEFVDVAVPDAALTGDDLTFPTFRASETAHVRVALHGFVLAQAVRLEASQDFIAEATAALVQSAGVIALPLPSRAAAVALQGADVTTLRVASAFEQLVEERDPALFERWTRDRRLVFGASERLAASAAAALGQG